MDKYSEIKKIFESREDKENAVAMSKYMRNMFDFYGLPTPKRKEVYNYFIKAEKPERVTIFFIFFIYRLKKSRVLKGFTVFIGTKSVFYWDKISVLLGQNQCLDFLGHLIL